MATGQSTRRIGRDTQRASSSSYVSYSLIFLTQGSDFFLPKTGLFTATVAAFIISYKQLSLDSDTTTVFFFATDIPPTFLVLGEWHYSNRNLETGRKPEITRAVSTIPRLFSPP